MKLQNRAARVGFDWPDAGAVLAKIAEETAELVEARDSGDAARVREEYGDLLFVMANLARHLRIDPEAALRAANAKFTRRFEAIEAAPRRARPPPADSTLAEMDALWDAAKERGPVSARSPPRRRSRRAAAAAAAECDEATQAEFNACTGAAFAAADRELNALYAHDAARGSPATAETLGLLTLAQRAWIAWRDAECDFSVRRCRRRQHLSRRSAASA